jgi:replication-associated recombination protein RarA
MSSPYFPFHALGYRCNPFRALTDDEWAEVAVIPEDAAAPAGGSGHMQVLGRMGRGKSTLLRGLAARLGAEGRRVAYEYLPEGERRFRTEASGLNLLFLDEAQRLGPRERDRLLSLAGKDGLRLVLGSHEDFSAFFRRRGLPLTTLSLDRCSEAHFRAVLHRRLEYFALGADSRVTLAEEAVRHLWSVFGSDLRAAERVLYEVFQQLPRPVPMGVEELRERLRGVPTTRSA